MHRCILNIERAYHTGLLYQLDAGDQYGDAASESLNGWSHTMKSLSGNADRFLAAGIYGYQVASRLNLSEIVRIFDKARHGHIVVKYLLSDE